MALSFLGIITEVIPVFARKPVLGYTTLIYATLSIAALSMRVVGLSHVCTGAVSLTFFSFMSLLIAV